eukprot:3504971-Pyramimonas_sp.AAC.1
MHHGLNFSCARWAHQLAIKLLELGCLVAISDWGDLLRGISVQKAFPLGCHSQFLPSKSGTGGGGGQRYVERQTLISRSRSGK